MTEQQYQSQTVISRNMHTQVIQYVHVHSSFPPQQVVFFGLARHSPDLSQSWLYIPNLGLIRAWRYGAELMNQILENWKKNGIQSNKNERGCKNPPQQLQQKNSSWSSITYLILDKEVLLSFFPTHHMDYAEQHFSRGVACHDHLHRIRS